MERDRIKEVEIANFTTLPFYTIDELNDIGMNEWSYLESNYEEYRPQYRPISTESGVTTTDTEVVAAETERERESAYVSRKRV